MKPAWREVHREWTPRGDSGLRALRLRMRNVTRILARTYKTPPLGNVDDPLDEAIYILLTYQTDVARAQGVWAELKSRFSTWERVIRVPSAVLEDVLRPSGFQKLRARMIKALLSSVRARFGEASLDALFELAPADAEAVLRALPGLDIKGARCVMMYSLGASVLPVDSNTFRFMQRFGVLRSSARYRRRSTHDEIQELVSPEDRYRLHVNLVVHGQRTCLPRAPQCSSCAVRKFCKTGREASRATS